MTTDSIGALYAGRFIMGLGNGLLLTFSQLYIQVSSLSPKPYRNCYTNLVSIYTGSLTSPLPRCNDLHLHVLDVNRLARRHSHRQLHSQNHRKKQLHHPSRLDLYHPRHPLRRYSDHPGVTSLASAKGEERRSTQGNDMVTPVSRDR